MPKRRLVKNIDGGGDADILTSVVSLDRRQEKEYKSRKSRKQKEAIRALSLLPPDGDNEQSEFIAIMASTASRGALPVDG